MFMQGPAGRPLGARSGDQGVAAVGALAGLAGLFSAAACCVLPAALAVAGISAGGLAWAVPWQWPLTIAAILVLSTGWLLYLYASRRCRRGQDCSVSVPKRSTFLMLSLGTLFVGLSAAWTYLEGPLTTLVSEL